MPTCRIAGTILFVQMVLACAGSPPVFSAEGSPEKQSSPWRSLDVRFSSHDGYPMYGKLVLPTDKPPRAIVVYVQTAEGSTVDMKRPLNATETFNYFDLYRRRLSSDGMGFFSYEGRGVQMGDALPRFEKIDQEVFDTSTLDNKTRDVLSAIRSVREQPECGAAPILLMGASEGTLLAAEAASREPNEVAGLVLYGILATNMRENFRYIMTDGGFIVYRAAFDADNDGKISKAEFENDPHQYRARVFGNADFEVFDKNSDGAFSADDMPLLTKPYLDAINDENYSVLQTWAAAAAGASVPSRWFEDHFAHDPIGTFLAALDMPVGCFHGAMDSNAPISAVKALEARAREAGKSNIEFHYFADLDHSLNIIEYFASGTLPAGHQAIFEFIDRITPAQGKAGD